mmetsp:Transcript_2460/g.6580  ORF Transcript_2460/g.6580 Transcript_2460/m.6580 type:complete len:487 (+) Transcript_2460:178-1638(+)|eukprot:CAMPEP_0174914620 /NCGR_PEP_ID=MMETSP0167-20121228/80935_1 /TAXON_ID=38298 /ORGANISM="Rhodella maculata, Strain CCMP736" /LENGTH=486 /DNA_ID=CAMNT_0016159389 /DNA_START=149 /DNA_END=1609 /DNA_ORIENTATION=+
MNPNSAWSKLTKKVKEGKVKDAAAPAHDPTSSGRKKKNSVSEKDDTAGNVPEANEAAAFMSPQYIADKWKGMVTLPATQNPLSPKRSKSPKPRGTPSLKKNKDVTEEPAAQGIEMNLEQPVKPREDEPQDHKNRTRRASITKSPEVQPVKHRDEESRDHKKRSKPASSSKSPSNPKKNDSKPGRPVHDLDAAKTPVTSADRESAKDKTTQERKNVAKPKKEIKRQISLQPKPKQGKVLRHGGSERVFHQTKGDLPAAPMETSAPPVPPSALKELVEPSKKEGEIAAAADEQAFKIAVRSTNDKIVMLIERSLFLGKEIEKYNGLAEKSARKGAKVDAAKYMRLKHAAASERENSNRSRYLLLLQLDALDIANSEAYKAGDLEAADKLYELRARIDTGLGKTEKSRDNLVKQLKTKGESISSEADQEHDSFLEFLRSEEQLSESESTRSSSSDGLMDEIEDFIEEYAELPALGNFDETALEEELERM